MISTYTKSLRILLVVNRKTVVNTSYRMTRLVHEYIGVPIQEGTRWFEHCKETVVNLQQLRRMDVFWLTRNGEMLYSVLKKEPSDKTVHGNIITQGRDHHFYLTCINDSICHNRSGYKILIIFLEKGRTLNKKYSHQWKIREFYIMVFKLIMFI